MEQYFFDKRVIKKFITKYLTLILISLPFCIFVNFLLVGQITDGWMIVIDMLIMAIFILIGQSIWESIASRRQQKQENESQLQKDRQKYSKKGKK